MNLFQGFIEAIDIDYKCPSPEFKYPLAFNRLAK
jgi:hypothetical protein